MGLSPNGKPLGRPQKPIDWNLFEELCHIQCTSSEIASVLKVSVDTLHDRIQEHYEMLYSEAYKRFSEGGKASLRRKQDKLATRNATMCIWLGKQWLGQKENIPETQVNEETNKRYLDIMQQLLELQSSARNSNDNNINNAAKSE